MVNAIPFLWLKGWHAPASRQTCEPRPLVQDGQIRPAPPVGASKNWGPADKSLARQPDTASADSEVRPGPRAPDATPPPDHRRGSHARSTIHTLPADYACWLIRCLESPAAHRSAILRMTEKLSGASANCGGGQWRPAVCCFRPSRRPPGRSPGSGSGLLPLLAGSGRDRGAEDVGIAERRRAVGLGGGLRDRCAGRSDCRQASRAGQSAALRTSFHTPTAPVRVAAV